MFSRTMLTYIRKASFCGSKVNSVYPNYMLQNTVSDQSLHCLLTVSSIKIEGKKTTTNKPYNGNGMVQLIRAENSIQLKRVKAYLTLCLSAGGMS